MSTGALTLWRRGRFCGWLCSFEVQQPASAFWLRSPYNHFKSASDAMATLNLARAAELHFLRCSRAKRFFSMGARIVRKN